MRTSLIFSFLLLLWSPWIKAQVWSETSDWSPAAESRFAEWVRENWSVDFFSRQNLPDGRPNPYYGLRMDCADTVYSMRIIFSYENGLPFAVLDPTGGSRLITNHMTRWNSVRNETQKIRGFLNYMYDLLSTKSLPEDTFPVPISREWIHAGGLIRTNEVNHHSWTIQDLLPIGVPHLVFNSTIGAYSSLILQQRTSWPNPEWVFQGDFSPAGGAGLRYWRPLSSLQLPMWQTPNYSEEQYRIPLNHWNDVVQKKLALRSESNQQQILRLEQNVCDGIKGRVRDVEDALRFLHQLRSQCMSAADYDTYSTPSRDHRLFDDMVALRRAYKKIFLANQLATLTPATQTQLYKIFPYIRVSAREETARMRPTPRDGDSLCVTEYGPGRLLDTAEAKRRFFLGYMSNNPMDELPYRWGEEPGPSSRAASCPNWGEWKPDLSQAD